MIPLAWRRASQLRSEARSRRNKKKGDLKMRVGEAATVDALTSCNLEVPISGTSSFYSFGDLSRRNGNSAGLMPSSA